MPVKSLSVALLAASILYADSVEGSAQVLNTVRAVHSLPLSQVSGAIHAKLRGVVSFYHPKLKIMFFEDHTGGISCSNRTGQAFERGDLVEIDSGVSPGFLTPEAANLKIRKVGRGPHPRGRLRSFGEIATGKLDCLTVQMEGVINGTTTFVAAPWSEDLAADPTTARVAERTVPAFWMRVDGRRIKVVVTDQRGIHIPTLIGSTVRVTGISAGEFNSRGQLTGFALFSTDKNDIRMVRPAPADPFDIKLQEIATVLRANVSTGSQFPTSRVRGIVTGVFSSYSVFISDTKNGLHAQLASASPIAEGDLVELVGTPEIGEYSPVLYDALIRVVGHGQAPRGEARSVKQVSTGRYDGNLVTISARLLSIVRNRDSFILALEGEGVFFGADLPADRKAGELGLSPGQILSLSGICDVQLNRETGDAGSFRLLLRSGRDVRILRRAAWWTVQKTFVALAILMAATGVVIGWVVALRKQVKAKTAELCERANRDGLTGLWNRTYILRHLAQELENAKRNGTTVAVVMIDLDHFKQINDGYGHQAGDEVLMEAAHRMQSALRANDMIGRYGGEEIVAVLRDWDPNVSGPRLEAIRQAVCSEEVLTVSGALNVTCSLGVSWSASAEETPAELLRRADAALYRAKRGGRNRCEHSADGIASLTNAGGVVVGAA